jgi:purine nucleosidase
MTPNQVIIDVDPGIGVFGRDVDDALAMFILLSSPVIALRGVTVNFGNVSAPVGYGVAREVLRVAGSDIPLFQGAASRSDLGRPNPAVEFMIETVRANPGQITLLGVAPLTNIATAMQLDPDFASQLGGLVVMGGSLNFKPFAWLGEFNFKMDSTAAALVLAAPVKKTLITMDVCSQVVFTKEQLRRLQQNPGRAARYAVGHIPSWLLINRILFRKGGFFPWDVIAAAYVIDPSLFKENPFRLSIQVGGLRAGRISSYERYPDLNGQDGSAEVNIPQKLDADRFMNLFMDGLLSLG